MFNGHNDAVIVWALEKPLALIQSIVLPNYTMKPKLSVDLAM